MTPENLAALDPDIRLAGPVNDAMLDRFQEQLALARTKKRDQPILLELTTAGGTADTARRIATDLRLCREHEQRDFVFLGKSAVYSAGVTIMAAFPPRNRFLTRHTVLLIHERRIERQLVLSGPLRACQMQVRDLLAEIESGQQLERWGFEQLIEGTPLTMDQLMAHVMRAEWYVPAEEAQRLGLVAGVL